MKTIFLFQGLCMITAWPVHGQTGSVVRIRAENGRSWLERNGAPYFVKGAVGYDRFGLLRDCGSQRIPVWKPVKANLPIRVSERKAQ